MQNIKQKKILKKLKFSRKIKNKFDKFSGGCSWSSMACTNER